MSKWRRRLKKRQRLSAAKKFNVIVLKVLDQHAHALNKLKEMGD